MKRFFKISFVIIFVTFIALFLSILNEWQFFKDKNLLNHQTPLDIVFAGDDNYIKPLSVALTSLNMTTKTPVNAFILTKGFNQINRQKLLELDEKLPHVTIQILPIQFEAFQKFPMTNRWNESIYFRYLIADILSNKDKVLYLDGDIVVLDDLTPLFKIDLGQHVIAGVIEDLESEEVTQKPILKGIPFYINSGVLLMDLDKMRQSDAVARLFDVTNRYQNEFTHYDQDAINLVFMHQIKALPVKYNAQHRIHTPFDKVIYHYSGKKKPWKSNALEFFEWQKFYAYKEAILMNKGFPILDYLYYLFQKTIYYISH